MKYDDREFDTMLQSAVFDLPPDDVVSEVNPWRKAIKRIVFGLALTSVMLNFWHLDTILPSVGMIFLLLGFRTLRRENGWLHLGYAISFVRFFLWYFDLILDASVIHKDFFDSFGLYLTVFSVALQFLLLFSLWLGIKEVQRKAELPIHAGSVVALMFWYLLILILSPLQSVGILFGIITLIAYVCALRSLWKLSSEIEGAGYLIDASPVRLPDWAVIALTAGVVFSGLGVAYTFYGRLPMDWRPKENITNNEVHEIISELSELGFPLSILDDMSEEDILLLKGARRVVVTVDDHPFNEGRMVTEYVEDSIFQFRGPGLQKKRVYDVEELRITGIAVELPGEKEQWRIIHHFLWTTHPGYFGTESIQLWSQYDNTLRGWRWVSACTGRVLFDKEGETLTAPFASLEREVYTSKSPIFGETSSDDVFAEFSFPNDGLNQRGYVSYTIENVDNGYLIDAWINYTHQQTWAQYPAMTAKQMRMANSWNEAGAFLTVQDALQFRPSEIDP